MMRFGVQSAQFGLLYAHRPQPCTGALAIWQRKDALWYIVIAQSGYNYLPVAQSRANFFPLFPTLIHIFAPIARFLHASEPYAIAGMAIS